MISPLNINPFALKRSSGGFPAPVQIGTIFENEFTAGDYSSYGGASATFNGNSITLTGGAGTNTVYTIYDQYVTSRNKITSTMRFTVDVFNGTSYGFGLMFQSINTSPAANIDIQICAITANNSENGKIYLFSTPLGGGARLISSAMAELPALNDELELIVEQTNCSYTITLYNLTKDPTRSGGVTATYSYALSYPYSAFYRNTGKMGFVMFGGTHTVTYWNVSSDEYKYGDLLIIGDSKTIGFGCTAVSNRYGALIASNNPTKYINVCGGVSDKTNEILSCINELKGYVSKKAVLCIGRNDLAAGISSGTWQSNYASIVSQLESVGTQVWHQLPLTEVSLNQSALTTWINANYTNIISVPGTWNAATDNVADGIHPNDGGHVKVYNNIMSTITL